MARKLGGDGWVESMDIPAEMRFVASSPRKHWQRRTTWGWHLILPETDGTFTLYPGRWPDWPGLTLEAAKERSRERAPARTPRPRPPTGICPACARIIRLDAAGRIAGHLRSRPGPGERNECVGSREAPRVP